MSIFSIDLYTTQCLFNVRAGIKKRTPSFIISWLRPSADTEASLAHLRKKKISGNQGSISSKQVFFKAAIRRRLCFQYILLGPLLGNYSVLKLTTWKALTARTVVTIDFYRSINKMDINQFRIACFYRLFSSCCNSRRDTKLSVNKTLQ